MTLSRGSFLRVLFYLVLLALVAISIIPFIMMGLASFKENYEILSLQFQLLPRDGFRLTNYDLLFEQWPYWRNILNSLVVAAAQTVIALFFCSLAGLAFAKYAFPGRGWLFVVLLATMMVPVEALVVPTYMLIRSFGWLNTYYALIIPGSITAFGVFLMRQFVEASVPGELILAARIDGCSEWRIYRSVVLPIITPALATLGILTFMMSWNRFLFPLVVVTRQELFTVPVALQALANTSVMSNYGVVMAAATLAALPLLVLYLIMQRWLMSGIMQGFMKL